MTKISIWSFVIVFILTSCVKAKLTPLPPGKLDSALDIIQVPESLGLDYTANFDRYTKVSTPNGGAIHIVAQTRISNEQIVRCRSILQHYLKNLEGSEFGNSKDLIADKMSDNMAILTLLNGKDDGKNSLEVNGQPLFEEEIQVEGHAWYMSQNFNHRDAAFEEILHLVHDYGIGVDGANTNPGAASAFQEKIRAAQVNALENNLWGIGADGWINELSKENSLSQEYLAALIDVYYGLWGANTENLNHGMGGLYVAKTREDISIMDPVGQTLLENKFFHPFLSYNARIDQGFEGDFCLKFNPDLPYTNHSRYLKNITLLGQNNSNVIVNELNNDITGNQGVNTLIFSGNRIEYDIETNQENTIITDNIANRDGQNIARKIEHLQFNDIIIDL